MKIKISLFILFCSLSLSAGILPTLHEIDGKKVWLTTEEGGAAHQDIMSDSVRESKNLPSRKVNKNSPDFKALHDSVLGSLVFTLDGNFEKTYGKGKINSKITTPISLGDIKTLKIESYDINSQPTFIEVAYLLYKGQPILYIDFSTDSPAGISIDTRAVNHGVKKQITTKDFQGSIAILPTSNQQNTLK
ncbi:MAG TPA: hypothetical protein PKW30_00425 [Campylobacterales bacterium]|nr:hypothetical protein [Campylobacterales bacterium]